MPQESSSSVMVSLLDHIAVTDATYRASTAIVEKFLRGYYAAMYQADAAYQEQRASEGSAAQDVFAGIRTAFEAYWQTPTPFSEYWTPCLSWPSPYAVTDSTVFEVKQDMLGNFVADVRDAGKTGAKAACYLIVAQKNGLRILNRFF